MPTRPASLGVMLVVLYGLLACEVRWQSPEGSSDCKPTFEGDVFGCLRISEGQQGLHASPAKLDPQGYLWGFNGGQWDAVARFRLSGESHKALRFQFFGIKASASFESWPSFCEDIKGKGLSECLSPKGDCSFVLEFRPPVPSESYQFGSWSRPTEAWVHTRLSEPTTCQLFEPRRLSTEAGGETPPAEKTPEIPGQEVPPEQPQALCQASCNTWSKLPAPLDSAGDTGYTLGAFGAAQEGDAFVGVSLPDLNVPARIYGWLKNQDNPLYTRVRFTPPTGAFSLEEPRRITMLPQRDIPRHRRYAVLRFAKRDSVLILGALFPSAPGGISNLSFANCILPFASGVHIVDFAPVPKQSRLFVGTSHGALGLVDLFIPAANAPSHKLSSTACDLTNPQPPLLLKFRPRAGLSLRAVASSSDGEKLFYFFAAFERLSGGTVLKFFDLDQPNSKDLHTSTETPTVMVATPEPASSRVFYGTVRGKVVLVDVKTAKSCTLSGSVESPVKALDLHPKGEQLLVLFQSGALELWTLKLGSSGRECKDFQRIFSAPAGASAGLDARLSGECSLLTALFAGARYPTRWSCSK